ncbi:DUF4176 domain-containing protein [Streptococcus intermedius]|uniref:DUF4176 domain-containing protein n=1 Tax=Streptococcus intermedius TaxID=1338 RepID=A0AAD1C6E6_STRIT|nr:DUF4176 domain-containing protein [Streptococcus intermedius]RSJ14700.1 hypothetical protein D8895_12780 [Streptococcus sp. BCA20]ALF27021.1 hypothetical protein RN88_00330 [Streptococcus intermedius]ARC26612.1 DUF4176 domain-containing protein [Streptococcus intermedius]EKU17839.1 hypothetical protein D593_0092 [Streptococcus intermedius BA1]RSJ09634.1 hypothetical protein D8833_07285 [Streptococcus intermedius]
MMLPVGSVVYLAEGNQKVIILNRGPIITQHGEDVLFDYTGALYPEGLNPEQVYYFNQEDIDEVVFEGYKDADEKRFITLYEKWLLGKGSEFKKGQVLH